MRTQQELKRNESIMSAIIADNQMSLDNNLLQLEEVPESFINSIYDVKFDEMTEEEAEESIAWIASELKKFVK